MALDFATWSRFKMALADLQPRTPQEAHCRTAVLRMVETGATPGVAVQGLPIGPAAVKRFILAFSAQMGLVDEENRPLVSPQSLHRFFLGGRT